MTSFQRVCSRSCCENMPWFSTQLSALDGDKNLREDKKKGSSNISEYITWIARQYRISLVLFEGTALNVHYTNVFSSRQPLLTKNECFCNALHNEKQRLRTRATTCTGVSFG